MFAQGVAPVLLGLLVRLRDGDGIRSWGWFRVAPDRLPRERVGGWKAFPLKEPEEALYEVQDHSADGLHSSSARDEVITWHGEID
jgi:hypothetical protein